MSPTDSSEVALLYPEPLVRRTGVRLVVRGTIPRVAATLAVNGVMPGEAVGQWQASVSAWLCYPILAHLC